MCEPLRKKKVTYDRDKTFEYFEVKDVASAVRFYKKYKNRYNKLKEEQEEIFNIWFNKHCAIDYTNDNEGYNDWLFDYCFGDVANDK